MSWLLFPLELFWTTTGVSGQHYLLDPWLFKAFPELFDPSVTTSFMLSLRDSFLSLHVLLRVFYAFFGLNVQSLRFLSLVFAYLPVSMLIRLAFAHVFAHFLFERSFCTFHYYVGFPHHLQ